MDNQIVDQVRRLLAELFMVPVEDIPTDLAFGGLPQWDLMGHMDVMISLEQRFGIEVNAETISQLISIPAICEYLEGKGLKWVNIPVRLCLHWSFRHP